MLCSAERYRFSKPIEQRGVGSGAHANRMLNLLTPTTGLNRPHQNRTVDGLLVKRLRKISC